MFQTTRRRLALWYTAVTAVLILLFASGFYVYVRSTLIERVDDTLSHIVEVVERSLVIESTEDGLIWSVDGQPTLQVNVEASFRNNITDDDDDHIDIEWFDPEGKLRWSTFDAPLNLPLHPGKKGETVPVSEQRYGEPVILRQLTDRMQQGRQVLGYLRVSHPWFEVSRPTRRLLLDLLAWTALMISGVGTIGWLLSGLAMEPVRASYQRLKQFTADASHELRNPIAMIQTNVQAALVDEAIAPQERQQLQVVERLTRRLGRLVDDLLFLARQDSGMVQPQREPVPLDGVLTEVVEEQMIGALEKSVDLELLFEALEPEWVTVMGDRDQLARLFTNLISNAIQYTPPEGQVRIQLAQASEARSYGAWPSQSRGRAVPVVVVRVEDSGVGIPPEAVELLFERFYRIDPARARQAGADPAMGSGLGLAIAQAIVEQHRGQIQVLSPAQGGSTFVVTLPVGAL
ncbi:MAG: sensor histidine kinase [Synechococcales cyanobacterium CRU_2_2]|nr:sensor histidine kinase [Synechococcales cyanobacterium CRU_2_2]